MMQVGTSLCWAMMRDWASMPIANMPPYVEKLRVKVRCDSPAVAVLKFADRVEMWTLSPSKDGKPCVGESDSIWLLYKIAENRTK